MKATPTNNLFYWATILAACTFGETAADFLSHGPMGLGYVVASLILGTGVLIALLAERRAKRPSEVRYWATIVIMATAGTTIADMLSRTFELGYIVSTALLTVVFAVTFVAWRSHAPETPEPRHPHDSMLPPEDIEGKRRTIPATNARYWAAIMVASTLGTTLGDALSNGTELGFGNCALLLGAFLAVLLTVEYLAKTPNEPRYWTALVTCSTIGATTGDWITHEEGLDLGYYAGTVVVIVVFVAVALLGYLFRADSGDELALADG
jgi:uncharacterized membrane-anchored protein